MDGEEGITGRQAGEGEAGRQAADIDALSIILSLLQPPHLRVLMPTRVACHFAAIKGDAAVQQAECRVTEGRPSILVTWSRPSLPAMATNSVGDYKIATLIRHAPSPNEDEAWQFTAFKATCICLIGSVPMWHQRTSCSSIHYHTGRWYQTKLSISLHVNMA